MPVIFKPPKIAIIVLNWNGKKDTLKCLSSLHELKGSSPLILVVDNGSSDDSIEAIRQSFPEIPILTSPINLGYAGGNNLGIEWALRKKAEWILLLNNDTVVPSDFLEGFLTSSNRYPEVKLWGAKILRSDPSDVIDHFGGKWNSSLGEFESLYAGEKDHPFLDEKEVDYVCGAALFTHRSVFEKIGLLEPKFFLFWEESDFCYRAKKEGFSSWVSPHIKLWHTVSSSFQNNKPHMDYFWWRNRLLWVERNLELKEKKELYKKVLFPQMRKLLRHFILKWASCLFFPTQKRKEQKRRLKAGVVGVFHFYTKRFGNAPSWVHTPRK